MRTIIFLLFFGTHLLYSQESKAIDISNCLDDNYTFANIYWDDIIKESLTTYTVTIVKQADPRNTPENYFQGTDETLINLLISIVPNDEYTESKLYKISLLNNPGILEVKESMEGSFIMIFVKFRNKKGEIFTKEYKLST